MKAILLIVAAWAVPLATPVLGINAWTTIWFYMEPVIGSVADPGTYFVTAYSGFVALGLSLVVRIGVTSHLLGCRLWESRTMERTILIEPRDA